MGAVMSYAMALSADRPPVAGILAFSGFVPTVEDWQPRFDDRQETRAFIAHGRRDPIIGDRALPTAPASCSRPGALESSTTSPTSATRSTPRTSPPRRSWLSALPRLARVADQVARPAATCLLVEALGRVLLAVRTARRDSELDDEGAGGASTLAIARSLRWVSSAEDCPAGRSGAWSRRAAASPCCP